MLDWRAKEPLPTMGPPVVERLYAASSPNEMDLGGSEVITWTAPSFSSRLSSFVLSLSAASSRIRLCASSAASLAVFPIVKVTTLPPEPVE